MIPLSHLTIDSIISHSYWLLLNSDGVILYRSEKWNSIALNNKPVASIFDLVSSFEIPILQQIIAKLSSKPGSYDSCSFTTEGLTANEACFDARFYSFYDHGQLQILLLADNVTDKVRLSNRLIFGFENSSDVIYEMDIINQRYNYVSPASFELFEITPEQALRINPGVLESKIHADDYQAVHQHFASICKHPGSGKRNFFIRYRYHHSVKGLRWVIDRHTVCYNNQSQPCLIVGNIRDITELQLSLEQITRNEKMFKGIVENSIDIISMIDRNGVIKFVSPSIEPILGYKPEDIINKHPFEFIDASLHDEVQQTMQKLIENPGQVIESQIYFKYASGRDVYLKSKFINYLDEPHIQAILGSTQDITEQKLAEQQLKDNFNSLNQIINNTEDPIWSVDSEMRLTVFNSAFSDMINQFFGFRPKVGYHLFDSIMEHGHPDQTECRQNFLMALSGKKVRFERTFELPDNRVVMDYSISPIINSEGIVAGATCFGRNITHKVLIRQQIQQQNEMLKKTNRELDRFVYSMSHDLRSPVASALGLIQVMEMEHQDSGTLHHILMLKKRLNRLDALLEDILQMVKQRKEEVKPQPIDFNELIQFIFENRGYREEAPRMELRLDLETQVPIVTDRAKLTTILENLISNAIKYRDPVKDNLKLHISCSANHEMVTIQVKDNGIGIADKHREKIFDMFFRASSQSNGSGLGLYIVKENLEAIQGSIHVESVLLEGTVFTIQLKNQLNSNPINLPYESIKNHLDSR
jgi:PAS domain S-box-containing protein